MEESTGDGATEHRSTYTTASSLSPPSSSSSSSPSFTPGGCMEEYRRPSEEDTSPQSCSMQSWSRSPLSELSSGLRNLDCSDSSPRRSPLLNSGVPIETRTPAAKRKGEGFISSQCCLSKMRRLRVRLSGRFPSSAPTKDPDSLAETQSQTPQRETEGCCGNKDQPHPTPLLPLWQVWSRWRLSPLRIPDSAAEDRNLIGDFSKPHLFPVERGDPCDLQGVSAQTVASLLQGKYCNAVESFLIVDCRYPYEYQGGHIMGAINLHSEAQVQEVLFHNPASVLKQPPWDTHAVRAAPTAPHPEMEDSPGQGGSTKPNTADSPTRVRPSPPNSELRKLIIFHCEFSSHRGPQLCRYLRKLDRRLNVYPQLFYPELYILQGGYREFHSHFPDLCDPPGYVPMIHSDFTEQRSMFQKKRRPKARRFSPDTVSELHF
ncbi:M-phase inducer phosphatase 1-like isoform X1 [Arapaima gigas]